MSACRRMSLRAAVVVAGLGASSPAQAGPTEAELMTEFIERFTRFIDWPPEALGGPDTPFVVCIVGSAPVQVPLAELARLRPIKGRRAVLRAVDASRRPDAIASCHVAFIAAAESKHLGSLLGHAEGRPVLTVADAPGFAAAGVAINFYRENRRLRFEINAAAAQDSGLKVRAKLLRLARPIGSP
jgi:hypothetical protein